MEKEKEENAWSLKIFGLQRRRKRREIFGEGKYIFFAEENKNGEGKGEKYLEKENTYFAEEKNEER